MTHNNTRKPLNAIARVSLALSFLTIPALALAAYIPIGGPVAVDAFSLNQQSVPPTHVSAESITSGVGPPGLNFSGFPQFFGAVESSAQSTRASADQSFVLLPDGFHFNGTASAEARGGFNSRAAGESTATFAFDLTEASYRVRFDGAFSAQGTFAELAQTRSAHASVNLLGPTVFDFDSRTLSITNPHSQSALIHEELLLGPGRYSIDIVTFARGDIVVGDGRATLDLVMNVTPVPLPASLLALASALPFFGAALRRRRAI